MTRDWKRRYIYIFLFSSLAKKKQKKKKKMKFFIFILLLSIFIPFYDHDTISKYIDSKFNYKNNWNRKREERIVGITIIFRKSISPLITTMARNNGELNIRGVTGRKRKREIKRKKNSLRAHEVLRSALSCISARACACMHVPALLVAEW